MRTAKIIVQEYLERGYSLESLRVLAESRSEPLRSELLALLKEVGETEVAEVACETAPVGGGGALFFVADDDESVAGEEFGIDFNLMSGVAPAPEAAAETAAGEEESVADVLGEMAAEESVIDVMAETDAFPEEAVAEESADAAVSNESSGDYLPGSVLFVADAFAAPPPVQTAEPAPVMETVPATVSEGASPSTKGGNKESRRERRRRERARKKQEKKARREHADMGGPLPEIVLARSEGTETMMPEASELPVVDETIEIPAPPEQNNNVVSVITPLDVVDEQIDEQINEQPEEKTEETVEEKAEASPPAASAPESEPEAEIETAGETDERIDLPSADFLVGDYAMVVAGGGDALRLDAYDLLAEEDAADADETATVAHNNVILFRDAFPDASGQGADGEEEYAPPVLRMLAVTDADETAGDGEAAKAADDAGTRAEEGIPPLAQLGLLRAFVGGSEVDGDGAAETADAGEHVIVASDLFESPVDMAAALAEERLTLEREYQERLDEFAGRLLELQAAAAESEGRAREKAAELEGKDREIAELLARRAEDEEDRKALDERLKGAREEVEDRDTQLACYSGMREEHERLYNEFEDLRKAYNEVVTEVMPGLQGERDELALTLERQVDAEDKLRSSLKVARKRLAVGYSMSAAACLMLLALPVANWLRSDDDTREFAMNRQQTAELRERAELAERRNVKAEETVAELERRLNLAAIELAKLEDKNGELSRRGRDLAVGAPNSGRPGGGTPTRASTMALQATPDGAGRLRVNEVRDPAGSIEQVYADNRSRQTNDGPQMAEGSGSGNRIQVSAVARQGGQAGANLRPPAANQAKADEVLAKVRSGEGVAQVVYRVLGTRDPEVINWVIRENNIKKDRRGNPRIYPEQELRLPQQLGQAASAAKR